MCPQFLIRIGEKQYRVELDQMPRELSSQLQIQPSTKLELQLRGCRFEAELLEVAGTIESGIGISIAAPMAAPPSRAPAPEKAIAEGFRILSPITGTVKKILVALNQRISRGQVVAIIEAMKMDNEISSDRDGEVIQILVSPGQSIRENQPLLVIR